METTFSTGKPIGTCIGTHDLKLATDAKEHLQKAGIPLLTVHFERRARRAFVTIDYIRDKDRAIASFIELHPDFKFDYNQGTTLYFKQDGTSSKVFELLDTRPKSSTLGQCEFCQLWFEHEDLFDVDDHLACSFCKNKVEDEHERRRVEEQIQDAMNALPTDQLVTIQLVFSIAYQSLQDKSEVPKNYSLWLDRAKNAISFKGLQSKLGNTQPQ